MAKKTVRAPSFVKRRTVGFACIADFRSVVGQELVAGIEQAAHDYDVNLVYIVGMHKYSVADDIVTFNHYRKKCRYLNTRNLDGLIFWASSFQPFTGDDEIRSIYAAMQPLPVVSVGALALEGASAVTTSRGSKGRLRAARSRS